MSNHLYAETMLTPGLGIPFQWRFQNCGRDLLELMDRESPVYGALEHAIERCFTNGIPQAHASVAYGRVTFVAQCHASSSRNQSCGGAASSESRCGWMSILTGVYPMNSPSVCTAAGSPPVSTSNEPARW